MSNQHCANCYTTNAELHDVIIDGQAELACDVCILMEPQRITVIPDHAFMEPVPAPVAVQRAVPVTIYSPCGEFSHRHAPVVAWHASRCTACAEALEVEQ